MENHQFAANIYGLFHQRAQIGQFIFPSIAPEKSTNHIFNVNYHTFTRGEKQIYLSEKLYNKSEIEKRLNYKTDNIAELILELIIREGAMGCRLLNGKFTIILTEKDQTTIIRDRSGEGRMIYFTSKFFTDSFQGLFDFIHFKAEPDLTGITTFLNIGYIPSPGTSLAGVSKVPAGEILYVNKDGMRFEKLFGFEEILHAKREPIELTEAVNQYSDLLKNSLERRIGEADQVGVLLSGGYDSGGNIALTRKVHSGTIKTYSIGFKNNPASELPYAKMMADLFEAEHHEYIMDGSEIEFLPEIIDAFGDPFSESGFMLNYSVMKMVANEGLQVTIGGDGNDQFFGAGIRETALHYKERQVGLAPLAKFFDKISDNSFFKKDNLAFRIRFQNQKILKVMEPETFGFSPAELRQMFDMNMIQKPDYLKHIPNKFKNYDELFLQRNYYLHLQHTANEVILFKASRMSDLFGVNMAFSYNDLDLYHFFQHLPIQLRAKGSVKDCINGKGISKYIHKELVKPMLPHAVTNRPKQGGFSPLEIFFNSYERRILIYNYIQNSSFAKSLKKNNFLNQFFEQYEYLANGKSYWFWHKQVKSNQLINLLIIAIWWDRVFENRKFNKLSDYLK